MAESQIVRHNSAHEKEQRRTQKLANTEARLVRSHIRELHSRWEKLGQEQHIIMSEWDQKQRKLWKNKRRLVLLAEKIAHSDRSKEAEKQLILTNLETAIEKADKDNQDAPDDEADARSSETIRSQNDKTQPEKLKPRKDATGGKQAVLCSKYEGSSSNFDAHNVKANISLNLPVEMIQQNSKLNSDNANKAKCGDKKDNSESLPNKQTTQVANVTASHKNVNLKENKENRETVINGAKDDLSNGPAITESMRSNNTTSQHTSSEGAPESISKTIENDTPKVSAGEVSTAVKKANNNAVDDELLPKLAGMGIFSYGHGHGLHPEVQGQSKLVTKLEMFADYDGTVLDFRNTPRGRRPRTPVPRFDEIVPVGRYRQFLRKEEERHHELIIRNKLSYFKSASDKKMQTIDDRLQTSSFKTPRAKSAFALSSTSSTQSDRRKKFRFRSKSAPLNASGSKQDTFWVVKHDDIFLS